MFERKVIYAQFDDHPKLLEFNEEAYNRLVEQSQKSASGFSLSQFFDSLYDGFLAFVADKTRGRPDGTAMGGDNDVNDNVDNLLKKLKGYQSKKNEIINNEENFKEIKALRDKYIKKNVKGKKREIVEKWYSYLDKLIVLDPKAKMLQKDEVVLKNKISKTWNVYRPKMKDKKGENPFLDAGQLILLGLLQVVREGRKGFGYESKNNLLRDARINVLEIVLA